MIISDNRYIFYSGGEPVAVWYYMADGTVERSGIAINGPVKVFYEPGVVACEMNFVNDVRDGAYVYYYPNGKISERGLYRGGMRTGLWNDYYEDGRPYRSFSVNGNGRISVKFEAKGKRPEFFKAAGYKSLAVDEHKMKVTHGKFNVNTARGYGETVIDRGYKSNKMDNGNRQNGMDNGNMNANIKGKAKSVRAPLVKGKAGKLNDKKRGNEKDKTVENAAQGKNEKNVKDEKGNTPEAKSDQQSQTSKSDQQAPQQTDKQTQTSQPQQQPGQQHQRGMGGSGAAAN
jgi:antitoxin component YwqK of YwqJK toxin-antitoxin module